MVDFQKDIKIDQMNISGERFERVTMALGPYGDIVLVEGRDKLAEQLLRAIVNDKTLTQGISLNYSTLTPRYIKTLFTLILRNFREEQIQQTEQSDARFLGYILFRFDSFVTQAEFTRITTNPITWKFEDTGLLNGFNYMYAIAKDYGTVESALLERIQVTPTQFQDDQNPVIGDNVVALPGNKSVTLYVNYNRYFKRSELLNAVQSIEVLQDAEEPRRFIVNITIKDLDDNQVSLSTARFNITKG
jgi:hypothetical protein